MPANDTKRTHRISREGLLLIKSFEGFRPRAVLRRDGVLTIGYGHTQTAREGIQITEAEAELLLLHDLIPVVRHINSRVRRPLNQHQFDALASFIFSIGIERFESSEVLELIRKGRMREAATALSSVPEKKPPATDLPYRRRCAEKALFEMAAGRKPTLSELLLAPVVRPVDEMFNVPEVPLGETGVVRHENIEHVPVTANRRGKKKKQGWRAFASLILLGAIGASVGILAIIAFRQGLDTPVSDAQAASIGLILCGIGGIFIAIALWAFISSRRLPKRPAQS